MKTRKWLVRVRKGQAVAGLMICVAGILLMADHTFRGAGRPMPGIAPIWAPGPPPVRRGLADSMRMLEDYNLFRRQFKK